LSPRYPITVAGFATALDGSAEDLSKSIVKQTLAVDAEATQVEELHAATSPQAVAAKHVQAGAKAITSALKTCTKGWTSQCVAAAAIVAAAGHDALGTAALSDKTTRTRLTELFEQIRVVKRDGKQVLLGAEVMFTIDLQGLKNKDVTVTWELYADGSDEPSWPGWLTGNSALKLRATTDDDRAAQPLFVPLPRRPGRYQVRLDAYVDGAPADSASSEWFSLS
jgi:hypothetical protein